MRDLDRTIHEPARLRILMVLSGVGSSPISNLLAGALKLTSGNLSTHLDRLDKAGYVQISKSFQGKMPRTECRLTASGRVPSRNIGRPSTRSARSSTSDEEAVESRSL